MKKAKFGVIGTGFWGRNHARVLTELENAELVAVCDVDLAKARRVGEKYDISWYDRDEALLKRDDIDAVSICTPTVTHTEVALKAVRFKKHALVEKPIASTIDEAKKILKTAEKKNVYLMTGFIERFNPGVQRIKALIEEGALGEVVLAFARRVGSWPERIGDVGVVKDAAIHDLDIMSFIFGEEPSTVYARAGSLGHKFEDYTQIILGFSRDKTAFVEANWLTPHKIRTLTVTGSSAIASVDYVTQEIIIANAEKTVKPRYKWEEPLMLELRHFTDCILKDVEPSVTGVDGLRALEVAEAALGSIRTGKVVRLH